MCYNAENQLLLINFCNDCISMGLKGVISSRTTDYYILDLFANLTTVRSICELPTPIVGPELGSLAITRSFAAQKFRRSAPLSFSFSLSQIGLLVLKSLTMITLLSLSSSRYIWSSLNIASELRLIYLPNLLIFEHNLKFLSHVCNICYRIHYIRVHGKFLQNKPLKISLSEESTSWDFSHAFSK